MIQYRRTRYIFSSIFVLFLVICACIPSLVNGRFEQLIQQIEERLALAEELVNVKDVSAENLQEGIEVLKSTVTLYEDVSNPTDDTLLSVGLNVYDNIGKYHMALARSHSLDPSKTEAFHAAETYFMKALMIVETYGFGSDAKVYFWTEAAKALIDQQRECDAAKLLDLVYMEFKKEIAKVPAEIRLLMVSSIGNCDAFRGVQLWNQVLEHKYVRPEAATKCKGCWAFVAAANAVEGGMVQLTEIFEKLQLSHYTPYIHPMQISPNINTKLLTAQPQPFREVKEDPICWAMEQSKGMILEEYNAYRTGVKNGTIPNLHQGNHEDAALSEESGGGWDGLFLRRGRAIDPNEHGDGNIGWQEHVCKEYFPKTCGFLRSFPAVSGKLSATDGPKNCPSHNNAGYPGWCRGWENQVAGVVAFYELHPGTELRMHTGPTNQRLKCHLIVTAPSDGSAWIEVGGVRKPEYTGDVIAFDDSYLHTVGNGGKEVRIIFEATFWHHDLAVTVEDGEKMQNVDSEGETGAINDEL